MKRASLWAGIIGGLLIANHIYLGAKELANPSDLPLVNVAIGIGHLLWIAFGLFLILIYLRKRQIEDAGHSPTKAEPDSPEDVERLRKKRNWILGFVSLVNVVGSAPAWILNDYSAGFTLINGFMIFDVVLCVILFCIAIELFRNRSQILGLLFYSAIIYGGTEGVIDIIRHHWFGALINFFVAFYFGYAIKAPLNRKNDRFAHLVILPAAIMLILALPFFDNGSVTELQKQEALLEQQFLSSGSSLNGSYNLVLQKEMPNSTETQDVIDANEQRDEQIQAIFANYTRLQAELEKQLPSVSQKETFERIRLLLAIYNLHKQQGEKVVDLMTYIQEASADGLSDEERVSISSMKKEIDSYNAKLTDAQFKLNNSNLIY